MILNNLIPTAALLVILTAFISLGIRNWRVLLLLLALQFIGVFLVITQTWSVQISATILISGVFSCLILFMTAYNHHPIDNESVHRKPNINKSFSSLPENDQTKEMSALFYYIAGIFIALLALSLSETFATRIDEINKLTIWITLILVSFGLLKISLSSIPLVIIHGLLTLISGFEILISFYDKALATAGLLSLFNLGVAIVGAYLISSESMEEIG